LYKPDIKGEKLCFETPTNFIFLDWLCVINKDEINNIQTPKNSYNHTGEILKDTDTNTSMGKENNSKKLQGLGT
jgi:hypothetical protein